MQELPPILARARAEAEGRPREPAGAETVEALRRAVAGRLQGQSLLLTKVLADGRAAEGERGAVEEALGQLARYFGVAVAYEPAPEAAAAHGRVLSALVLQARALAAAAEGARPEGRRLQEAARAELEGASSGVTVGEVEARAVHRAAERVYDRVTGRSRYDAEAPGWLSFQLRCPEDDCRHAQSVRLLGGWSTHRVECARCHRPYTVYFGTVASVQNRTGQGTVAHEVETRDVDGTMRALRFEEVAQPPGLPMQQGDLLVVLYDSDNRVRTVRNYGRGLEVRVAPGSRCFVATAALGPFAPEVTALRRLRDEVLVRSGPGRAFVAAYEVVGPPLARQVGRHPAARALAGALVRAAARHLAGRHLPR